jgi:hypothetical protein
MVVGVCIVVLPTVIPVIVSPVKSTVELKPADIILFVNEVRTLVVSNNLDLIVTIPPILSSCEVGDMIGMMICIPTPDCPNTFVIIGC